MNNPGYDGNHRLTAVGIPNRKEFMPGPVHSDSRRCKRDRSLIWIVLLLMCGAAWGCRSRDSDRQLIHREMRLLEDEIYYLEDELEASYARLESCRRENDALRKELGGSDGDGLNEPDVELRPPRINLPKLPNIERPADDGDSAPPFEPGQTSDESDDDPEVRLAPPGFSQQRGRRSASRRLAEVRFNRRLTGGYNADGHPGDEGVLVVLEPRNADGRLVEAFGDVTLFVNDPALPADERTVARWSFTADEIAARFKETPMGTGVHLRLPWPNDPPRHESLELLVRYAPAAGSELVARRTIDVDLQAPLEASWTQSKTHAKRSGAARGSLSRFASNHANRAAEAGWNRSKNRPEDIELLSRSRRKRTSDTDATSTAWARKAESSSPAAAETSRLNEPPAASHRAAAGDTAATERNASAPATPIWRPYR
jgi:hypothetical protein